MARWIGPDRKIKIALEAAQEWKRKCLFSNGSILSDKELWTIDNLEALDQAINQDPLHGKESFYVKLEKQISNQPTVVTELAAECLWLLLLFISKESFTPDSKRSRLSGILALIQTDLNKSSHLIADPALDGVGWVGTAFLTMIPNEFSYLVEIAKSFKKLSVEDQRNLLKEDNPWGFCEWVTGLPDGNRRIFRQVILFLLFPDYFERICSKHQKRNIVKILEAKYEGEFSLSYDVETPCDIDKALYDFRGHLNSIHDTKNLDFYLEPLRSLWDTGKRKPGELRYWIEKTIVRGRPDRLDGEHSLGVALWSPQNASNGADIYKSMREVAEGDIIIHLIDNKTISGVSIAASSVDPSFTGLPGTDWAGQKAYRIELTGYEKLEPPLARDSFLSTEPAKTRMSSLIETGQKGLFFNKNLDLNQGKYLTPAPAELVEILNAAYMFQSQKTLPYIYLPTNNFSESEEVREEVEEFHHFDRNELTKDLFLSDDEIDDILLLWRSKKNLIMQGPPGVGKSFAAKRLAMLLNQSTDLEKIGLVQFHQSYSYEDFVEGFRPSGDGFILKQGKFVNFCKRASASPENSFVFIIDEINRGNLSKIMGELMLLIEPDKRDKSWEIELSYGSGKFHVPNNVYILGLMNTADRSLAVVDYALRRRFAFIDLAPKIISQKFAALITANGIDQSTQKWLITSLSDLNDTIRADTQNLGSGFEIGHSFFCTKMEKTESGQSWYNRIIRTEVVPLLREYWFDAPEKVETWRQRLLLSSQ